MRDLRKTLGTRAGLAIAGAGLVALGAGFGTAAVISHPQTGTVSDTAPITTDSAAATTSDTATSSSAAPVTDTSSAAATTSSAPAPTSATATVDPVTTPTPTPDPSPTSPESTLGKTVGGGVYIPEGPAPIGSVGPPPPAEKLPGENGYVPPSPSSSPAG